MKFNNLRTTWIGREFHEFDRLPCTNDYCKEQMEALAHGAVVFAQQQYSGRGTKGRPWQDEPGQGIALSVVFKDIALADLAVLPLICGLAESLALKGLGADALIKWPNDIVLGGKKISGILCESTIMSGAVSAVCGIGINVLQHTEQFAQRGLPYAGSLYSETGQQFSLGEVTQALLNRLEEIYDTYLADGFSAIKPLYLERCVTLDREVWVLTGDGEKRGIARGISDDGRLLCEIDGTVQMISHGEASVRGLWGYV